MKVKELKKILENIEDETKIVDINFQDISISLGSYLGAKVSPKVLIINGGKEYGNIPLI